MNAVKRLLAAARCWERAGYFECAADHYARAAAWAEAGLCWAKAGRTVDAAEAYARAGDPIGEARQWLASPWPERARRLYRKGLEMGISTSAEVEALLGLSEVELASERAFAMIPEKRSVEALCALARIAAARGRPDLAARAWDQAIATSPAAACEVFEVWRQSVPWNQSLGWGQPQGKASGWPSRAIRGARLELVWEEKLGRMIFGNRGLVWSPDGRKFAAARQEGELALGELIGPEIRLQLVKVGAYSIAFIPESDSVLVGCRGGQVTRVDAAGTAYDIEALRLPGHVWAIAFSPQGDRVAVSSYTSQGACLRIWSWDSQGPREMLQEERAQGNATIPACVWSPEGRTLAWCPSPWSRESVSNDLFLFTDAGERRVSAAHENGINGIAFSFDGRYLITASLDQTLALRDAHTGEIVAPPWNCAQRLETVVFHPHAALLAAGGEGGDINDFTCPSRLYLLQLSQADLPQLKIASESFIETAVKSLAFSPDGEHLLMSTNDRLSLFRVHSI